MNKHWFLIESMGVTIDLGLVTEVEWNASGHRSRATRISSGTDIAYDSEAEGIAGNNYWIWDTEDRKRLQTALISLGLPTIELIFEKENANARI